jgi:hypothetical protein
LTDLSLHRVWPSIAAENQMLLFHQEYGLLRNFEAKDNALAFKLNKSQTEKAEVVAAINDCQAKLNAKRKVCR